MSKKVNKGESNIALIQKKQNLIFRVNVSGCRSVNCRKPLPQFRRCLKKLNKSSGFLVRATILLSIIDLKPGELNSILHQIQQRAIKNSYDALILCAGDIPLLTRGLIDIIKKKLFSELAKKGKSIVVCPSKNDGVSIIAMSPTNLWMITSEKGVNNLKVIEGLNREKYPYKIMNDFRAYLDLDHRKDLFSAYKIMEKNPEYEKRLSKKILGEISWH
jgi:2-phospho-L-lactate guanylyltransferase (CobY/MobA/RfbA family)